mgnify:FL=1
MDRWKKILPPFALVCFVILYFCYIYYRVSDLPCNSDTACMLLEAKDILHGNFFLADWQLTGITFITTDMPYFLIGTLIFGVDERAAFLAITLMYVALVTASFLLLKDKNGKRSFWSYLLFAAIAIIPTNYAIDNARVHTSVYVWVILAIYFADRAAEKQRIRDYIMTGLFAFLAVCGDSLGILTITLPLLIVCITNGVKKPMKLGASVAIGTVAGLGAEKLYLLIGGAEKNSLIWNTFAQVDTMMDKLLLCLRYPTLMLNADFFGTKIFTLQTLFYLLRLSFILFAFWIIFRSVCRYAQRKDTDRITLFLAGGFLSVYAVFLTTNINAGITCGRYVIYLPVLFGILIVRCFNGINLENIEKRKRVIYKSCIGLLCCVMLVGNQITVKPVHFDNARDRLSAFLEQQQLYHGYAAFFDAQIVTLNTREAVTVRAIEWENGNFQPNYWFCKNSWYDEYANYIIIMKDKPVQEAEFYENNGIYNLWLVFGDDKTFVSSKNVIAYFGEPERVLAFEGYDIYIYPYDISNSLFNKKVTAGSEI